MREWARVLPGASVTGRRDKQWMSIENNSFRVHDWFFSMPRHLSAWYTLFEYIASNVAIYRA